MKTYSLPSRSIPLDDRWDVIVVGGGPAGCTAAAASAREGARTLLVEATGALGGMGTNGLVPAWCPFSDKRRIVYGGMAEQVFRDAKTGVPHVPETQLDWVPINPEHLKRLADDLVLGHGADVLFHTSLAAVEHDGEGTVDAIIVANKGGLSALRARVFIDCTGDGDLCAWAGAETVLGDGKGGGLMPATHCFVLTNVDEYGYRHGPQLHAANKNSPIYRILESGKYPQIPDAHLCNNLIGPRTVGFNAGHVFDVDNTDPVSLSRSLTQGRKLAQAYRDALAEFFPEAFGNAYLALTGSLMGIRESRRVLGDYVLTLDDYLARRTFSDEICRNSYYIDVHNKSAKVARTVAQMQERHSEGHRYGPGETHGIPYRCLTPKALRNVLVAGRSVSCEQLVQGSVRVMPVCLAMGEAAGMAAGMALSAPRADVHAVDTDALRGKLRAAGAYLPE